MMSLSATSPIYMGTVVHAAHTRIGTFFPTGQKQHAYRTAFMCENLHKECRKHVASCHECIVQWMHD